MIISGCRWPPAVTLLSTGDTGVLDEPVHFLEGRPLNAEEDSYYDLPARSEETATLVRALRARHPARPDVLANTACR